MAEKPKCACGCGDRTGGGTYLPGHDAKHKSSLVKEAMAGNEEAEATLASKGWTKFLIKAQEIAARPPKEVKERRERGDTQRDPTEAGDIVQAMKAARVILKKLGQYQRATPNQIILTAENAVDVIVGNVPGIRSVPEAGMWRHFDDKQRTGLKRHIERNPRYGLALYADLREWLGCGRMGEQAETADAVPT